MTCGLLDFRVRVSVLETAGMTCGLLDFRVRVSVLGSGV